MATTTYYVNLNAGANGNGSVGSPFNTLLAAGLGTVAGAIASGDIVDVYVSGQYTFTTAWDLTTQAWSGPGKLRFIGDQANGFIRDATKTSIVMRAGVTAPFYTSMVGGLQVELHNIAMTYNTSGGGSLVRYTPVENGAIRLYSCPIRSQNGATTAEVFTALTTNSIVHNASMELCSVGDGFNYPFSGSASSGLVFSADKCSFYSLNGTTFGAYHASASVSFSNSAVMGPTAATNVDSVTYCATGSGLGTNAVTVSDWATQFVDAANGDFTLAPGSALIGAGQSGINIGAYQAAPYIQSVTPASIDEGGTVTIEIRDASSAPTTVAMVTGNASVSRSLTQTSFSGGTYIGTFTAPASVDAVDIRPGSYSLNVTVGATNLSQSGLTLTCDAGQSYLQMGTPNTTSDYRLQSTPTFVSGDYIVFGYWHNASDVSQGIYPDIDADGVVHYPDGWEYGWYFVWKLWDSEEITTGEFWGAEATYTLGSGSAATVNGIIMQLIRTPFGLMIKPM